MGRANTRQLNNITISKCRCPECDKDFPIPRERGRRRKEGHHKDIWCPFCKKKITMVETYF